MLVRNAGYQPPSARSFDKAQLIDDMTSTSNSSSSLNIDVEIQHRSNSGVATPTSNQSTSSLIEVRDQNGFINVLNSILLVKKVLHSII